MDFSSKRAKIFIFAGLALSFTSYIGYRFLFRRLKNAKTNEKGSCPYNKEGLTDKPHYKRPMSKKFYKICLTSGSGIDLEEVVAFLSHELSQKGFDVVEAPFEKAHLNLDNRSDSTLSKLNGVLNAIKTQMTNENKYLDICEQTANPTILICKRGLMDYLSELNAEDLKNFTTFIRKNEGWTIFDIKEKRYDAIVHICSANEDHANDNKILGLWAGHPNHSVVNNLNDGLEGKFRRTLNAFSKIIDLPGSGSYFGSEKLLFNGNVDKRVFPSDLKFSEFSVEDTFLKNTPDGVSRWVMRRTELTGETYSMLASKSKDGTEQLKILTEEMHLDAIKEHDPDCRLIRKNRITFLWKNEVVYLDTFIDDGFSLLRIEREKDQAVVLPPFLTAGPDVSKDPKFKTQNIAKKKDQLL